MNNINNQQDNSKSNNFVHVATPGVGDAFVHQISHLVNKENVETLSNLQTVILEELQKSNQTITSFNDFSVGAYNTILKDYERRTKLLKEMKRDLEIIFRKIRNIKTKIQEKYSITIE